MADLLKLAEMLAKSNMIPTQFKNKKEDIIVAVMWGEEVGLQPIQALQNIAVINGKPSIYGDAALSLVTGHSQYAGHKEWYDQKKETAYCQIARKVDGNVIMHERKFSVADAKKAHLWGRRGPWENYPERMLQMRARGFALRDSFPDALKGVITVEEAQDLPEVIENPLDKAFGGKIEAENCAGIHEKNVLTPEVPEKTTPHSESNMAESGYILNLRDEGLEFGSAEEFLQEYSTEMLKIANDEGINLEERRHNCSVLREDNQPTLDRCNSEMPEAIDDINKRYIKLIKKLSAMIEDGKIETSTDKKTA
jgi:hypothetical protein